MHRRRWVSLSVALSTVTLSLFCLPSAVQAASGPPAFRVGIQFSDHAGTTQFGVEQFTGYAKYGNTSTPWAGDANGYDPDAVRINLDTLPEALGQLDFRIGAQAMDNGGHYGPPQFTPWASQGGGASGLATDDNGRDPDKYRLFLETRSWPSSVTLTDFRLSVTAVDHGVPGVAAVTPWASQGGGRTTWAVDSNSYDFDGIVIGLEVQ